MLRGHETLARLVRPRRRLKPASSLSLSNSAPHENGLESAFGSFNGVHESIPFYEVEKRAMEDLTSSQIYVRTSEGPVTTWVKCPVCGKDVKGDDQSINIHLDLCLLEKKPKSKSNQSTLSHFTKGTLPCKAKTLNEDKESVCISKKMKVDVTSASFQITRSEYILDQSDRIPILDTTDSENVISLNHDLITRSEEKKNIFAIDQCNCDCHLKTDALHQPQIHKYNGPSGHVQDENVLELYKEANKAEFIDGVNNHPQEEKSPKLCTESAKTVENQSIYENNGVYILDTVIVGRKFNQHTEIHENMLICAIREPENVKDQNAIKIVSKENKSNRTIGHLPRTVASLFSCILDRCLFDIQGIILRVPEKLSEPVPIRLQCEKRDLGCNMEDSEFLEQTWQKIQEIVAARNERENSASIKYLQNFTYVLKAVLEHDSCLFSEEEMTFLGSFFSLTQNARCLFVRLSQRKGPWFRVSEVNYAEIPNVMQSCSELLASGFLSSSETLEGGCMAKAIKERIKVLNVPELKHLLLQVTSLKKKPRDLSKMKRDELLDLIVNEAKARHENKFIQNSSPKAAIGLIVQMVGLCVRLSDMAGFLLWRIQRLFFLNGEQDLSAFLLADMGAVKYPVYVCFRTRSVFISREALLSYEQALEVAEAMDIAVENDDRQTIEHCMSRSCKQLSSSKADVVTIDKCGSVDIFLERFTAGWVYTTILTLGVSFLERDRRYSEAIGLLKELLSRSFCPGRRGYWTTRLSIDLEHIGRKEESLEVAESALNDFRICNGDRIALQRRVIRLAKPPRRWKKPCFVDSLSRSCKEVFITGRPLNCKTGEKSRFYSYDNQLCGVEELALQYYAGVSGGGWQGVHSESGIWMTLFALLMWDVLFANVPNVFWHPFQNAPLDLDTDAFYPRRKSMIEEQLQRIRCGDAPQLLASTWSKHFGRLCRGLNWERQSLEELQVIVSCIGGCGLASICKVLAEDYSGLGSGMPDLLLWRVTLSNTPNSCHRCSFEHDGKSSRFVGRAKLVEVKGPRDRLSEQQQAWIYLLMDAGIEVEVCKVLEQPKS